MEDQFRQLAARLRSEIEGEADKDRLVGLCTELENLIDDNDWSSWYASGCTAGY